MISPITLSGGDTSEIFHLSVVVMVTPTPSLEVSLYHLGKGAIRKPRPKSGLVQKWGGGVFQTQT